HNSLKRHLTASVLNRTPLGWLFLFLPWGTSDSESYSLSRCLGTRITAAQTILIFYKRNLLIPCLTMNAVLIAVVVMLVLALVRVHVVVAMFLGSVVRGLLTGQGLDGTTLALPDGLGGGAKCAWASPAPGPVPMGG